MGSHYRIQGERNEKMSANLIETDTMKEYHFSSGLTLTVKKDVIGDKKIEDLIKEDTGKIESFEVTKKENHAEVLFPCGVTAKIPSDLLEESSFKDFFEKSLKEEEEKKGKIQKIVDLEKDVKRKLILHNGQSPGDICMMTSGVRDLHKSHPNKFLTDVRTPCSELWENNPYITKIEDDDDDAEHIHVEYPMIHQSNQGPWHFAQGFTQHLSDLLDIPIKYGHCKGDIHISDEEKGWYSQVREITGKDDPFWIIISGGKFDFTCIHEDSRVLIGSKYVKIKDVDKKQSEILSEYGKKSFSHVQENGVKPTLEIKTSFGDCYKITHDHLLRVLSPDGNLRWEKAENLSIGDKLLHVAGDGGMLQEDNGDDLELWYCIGHLWGDGFLTPRNDYAFCVPEHEIELKEKIEKYLDKEGIGHRLETTGEEGEKKFFKIYCTSPQIRKYFPDFEYKGKWRRHGLPESYWGIGRKQMGSFLNGVFSTDGSISEKGNITFNSVYEDFCHDIKEMLFLLGIRSTKTEDLIDSNYGKCISHNLILIGRKSVVNFSEKVNFSVTKKKEKLLDLIKSKREQDKNGIPYASVIINNMFSVREKLSSDDIELNKQISQMKTGQKFKTITQSKLAKIVRNFNETKSDNKAFQFLKSALDNDWVFTEITNIQQGDDSVVYDVINCESESYVSNGIVSHNCKWWHPPRYQKVVDALKGRVQFVQAGEDEHNHPALNDVIDLRGKTDLRQLIRLVYHSSGVICPVTFLMHLAASVPVPENQGRLGVRPCVVLAGGREPMRWEAYTGQQYLNTCGMLPCCDGENIGGGCWKSRTMPIGDGDKKDHKDMCEYVVKQSDGVYIPKCLDMITPEMVVQAVEGYLEGQQKWSRWDEIRRYTEEKQQKERDKVYKKGKK